MKRRDIVHKTIITDEPPPENIIKFEETTAQPKPTTTI